MKLRVYGRPLEVVFENGEWAIFTLGEGKKSKSNDIVIPAHFTKPEVLVFLADIFHEAATPENPDIVVLGDEN